MLVGEGGKQEGKCGGEGNDREKKLERDQEDAPRRDGETPSETLGCKQ